MSNSSNTETAATRNTLGLQAAAALLIANSHLEAFYPRSWMAADGFIGNSIFFFLSGYGIAKSLAGKEQSFGGYYGRRVLRIYPTVWLVAMAFHFLWSGGWRNSGWTDYLRFLIYPTAYTFVEQIMVFYAVLYLLKRWLRPEVLPKLFALLFLPLLGLFGYEWGKQSGDRLQLGSVNLFLWWVFFFQAMLWGSLVALKKETPVRGGAGADLLKMTAVFSAYVTLKFMMVLGCKIPGTGLPCAQFYILLHLLMFPLIWYAFRFGTSSFVQAWLQRHVAAGWFVGLVGGATLEIYTVHRFVMDDGPIHAWKFPLNVLAFFAVTLVLSVLVNRTAAWLRSLVPTGAVR